jgi:hypothetical protein
MRVSGWLVEVRTNVLQQRSIPPPWRDHTQEVGIRKRLSVDTDEG